MPRPRPRPRGRLPSRHRRSVPRPPTWSPGHLARVVGVEPDQRRDPSRQVAPVDVEQARSGLAQLDGERVPVLPRRCRSERLFRQALRTHTSTSVTSTGAGWRAPSFLGIGGRPASTGIGARTAPAAVVRGIGCRSMSATGIATPSNGFRRSVQAAKKAQKAEWSKMKSGG